MFPPQIPLGSAADLASFQSAQFPPETAPALSQMNPSLDFDDVSENVLLANERFNENSQIFI